jgi:phosphate transport system substrate-binding protein
VKRKFITGEIMKKLVGRLRYSPLAVLALLVVGSLLTPGDIATGVATCPVVRKFRGSTTVFPIMANSEGPFEASRVGTDAQLASIGSGNGLNELRLFNGTNHLAPSSRALNGTELGQLYAFNIARDGFVMAVRNSGTMGFINNITKTQVEQIYEGTITNWNQLGGPSAAIVPRARITGSGTQPDFLSNFSVDATAENNVINATGLPRLVESSDMAAAAAGNDFQIAYTSLANLDFPGMKVLTLNSIPPSQATVGNGTYPALRTLWLAVAKTAFANRIDDSSTVLADDMVNFALSQAGQIIAAAEFVPVGAAALPPIPDWDVNMDGNTSLSDLGAITARWGQTSGCQGWIRADANNNSGVTLGDIGVVTSRWGNPGFQPPN